MKKLLNSYKGIYSLLIIATYLLSGCSNDDVDPIKSPDYLESHEVIKEISLDELKEIANSAEEILIPTNFMTHSVKAVKITYKTVCTNNEEILASGAIIVPESDQSLPVVSFQHGTIVDEESAPSNLQGEFTDMTSVLASAGFVMVLPDYIGYGASQHADHPYEHRASLATACRDMLRATFEYFEEQNMTHGNKVFLTGYSEGGFATMATAKLLQEESPDEFNIEAITVGAGAYNKSEFARWVVESEEELKHINSFVWVLDTYNNLYPQLQRDYSYYFQEPWATSIANNGVWTDLDDTPANLFTAKFIEGVTLNSDTDLLSALADNDCYNWKPRWPIQLYHGTDDVYVPFLNSQTAYDAMIANGTENVELIAIERGTHSSAVAEYAEGTFNFFFTFLFSSDQ